MGRVWRSSSVSPKPRALSLDMWLQRAAHLTQVLLLGLGIFGYFYTVRPIHQKEILDEEIAQKRIELREKEKEMRMLAENIRKKSSELDDKDRALGVAKSDARSAKSEARESYSELRIQLLGQFTNRVKDCAQPALKQRLDSGVLKTCPKLLEDATGYLLEKLKMNDRQIFLNEVRKALDGIRPQFEALVQKRQNIEEADMQEAANIQSQIDAIPPTPEGERPMRSSIDRFQLQLRLSAVRDRERGRRFEAYDESAKILSGAGSVTWDKVIERIKI